MPFSEHAISVTEAAYDLSADEREWLPQVLEVARPMFARGLGFCGLVGRKPPTVGPADVRQIHVVTEPEDFALRHGAAVQKIPTEIVYEGTRPGFWLLSEQVAGEPEYLDTWRRHIGFAQDAFGVIALDPDGWGVHLIAGLSQEMNVTQAEREGWNMIAAHLSAGLRLRRATSSHESGSGLGDDRLPFGAEAVLDPSKQTVVDARDVARSAEGRDRLREAAIRVDRARGRLRREAPNQALETWSALMSGRWSIVDWFDSDRRRYVLAIPNGPRVRDPRGLTSRERQVVAYAAIGESHKMIAYRLGIARPTVTNALRSAMRKLGVKKQAQLVEKIGPLLAADRLESG